MRPTSISAKVILKSKDQQEKFIDNILPLPSPDSLIERVRKESEYAKQLAASMLQPMISRSNS